MGRKGGGDQAVQQPDVLQSHSDGVQRALTAHTLFFDILSESDTEARCETSPFLHTIS